MFVDGIEFDFFIEVYVYVDEEGVCFLIVLFGLRVFFGSFDLKVLKMWDKDNVFLEDVLVVFGGNFGVICFFKWNLDDVLGYLEMYIE